MIMNLGLIAFAEGEAANQVANGTQPNGAGSFVSMFISMGVILVLFYFMMIRPQKKREKETQAMQDSLKVGDRVVTIGGLVGKVAKIKDEFFYLETSMPGVAEKSYIKMERSAIKEVTKKSEDKKKPLSLDDIQSEENDETEN